MIARSPAGESTRWIAYPTPRRSPRVRLYCFPFAGGGASTYRRWSAELPDEIEVRPVQPPGREGRIGEPPFRSVGPLVEALAGALPDDLGEGLPFAFFGHSLGALVAYELARLLERRGRPGPVRLMVSAHRAPQQPPTDDPIHDLPEERFRQRLRELNGTPEAVLEHPELMELLGPLLRADFELNETYRSTPGEPLACPLTAFGGDADPGVTIDDLRPWAECTRGPFDLHVYPGDHFYLQHDGGLALRRRIALDLTSAA